MYVYGLIIDATNEMLPIRLFTKQDAIEEAKKLKTKDKADYRVISLSPVYSTKEENKQADIEF